MKLISIAASLASAFVPSMASLSGISLVAVSSIHGVSARLVASSDIHESIKKSTSFSKMKGDECVMLEDDTANKDGVEIAAIGNFGCGEDLTCLEDESSLTGGRCVDVDFDIQNMGKKEPMVEYSNAVIKNADMSEDMIDDAVNIAQQALEMYNVEMVRK